MSHRYQQSGDYGHNTPYQSVDYNGSSAALNGGQPQQHTYPASYGSGSFKGGAAGAGAASRPWYKKPIVMWGVPVLVVAAIAGGVAGGVLASRDNDGGDSASNNRGIQNNAADRVSPASTNGGLQAPLSSSPCAVSCSLSLPVLPIPAV